VHLHTEDGGILIIADDASGEAWPVLCEECCGRENSGLVSSCERGVQTSHQHDRVYPC